VYRAVPCLMICLSFAVAAAPGQPPNVDTPKRKVSVEEIKKAIAELGNQRFAVRDKAKKVLLDAGAAAEPFLEEAARSPDAEISSTAKTILEKLEWGLYPDTPNDVRELIDQFRSGMPEQRQNAIGSLLKKNPVPFATIRKLLLKEENVDLRDQMFVNLQKNVREAIPQLLARGDLDAAEEMFDLTLTGSPSAMAGDYATFMYLRGKLDTAIARFEKQRRQTGEAGKRAAELLVYLYRNKGDWKAARQAAEDTMKDDLVDLVLWQSSDWKALAAGGGGAELGNLPGTAAAYARLAGNQKEFDEKIAQIKKSADEADEAEASIRLDANALLLNGKANDAIAIMADKKKELALTFDLLCAQMKHKEAFDLVDEARRRDTDPMERSKIEVRRARMLYMLGEKETAIQLFEKIADDLKSIDDDVFMSESLPLSLIKTEVRAGLRDRALIHAGKIIELYRKAGKNDGFAPLLQPIFGDNNDVAQAWLALFFSELPSEKPELALQRVSDILEGKLEPNKLDVWIDKIVKASAAPVAPVDPRRGLPSMSRRHQPRYLDAAAAAYKAVGNEAKTEEFLKKAAERTPSPERWIAHGDFLMGKKKFREAANSYANAVKAPRRQFGVEIEIENGFVDMSEEYGPALPTYLQGRALLSAGEAKEGKRLIELAHWLPLGNDEIRAKLVEELNKRDWSEMARKEADMLLKTGWYNHFMYGNVLSFLARQAAKDKNYFASADYYEKCLVGCLRTGASFVEPTAYLLVPESVRVYRAQGCLAKGEIDKAEQLAISNLEAMPGNVDIAIKLVPELEKLGKKKEADAIYGKVRDAWEKLCKDYPNSAFAHNSAAWVMANCRRELDAALKHAQKAVEVEPKSAGYIDTLAEVHFRKGERDKAIALMKQCVELEPQHSYFRKQLVRFKDQPLDSPTPDEGEDDD
jgi:tetratricopeptide (TPR) repeat protein